ncbi:hypothetical protein BJF86_13185 [Serinicoccus sp. CNJ-927]|nr:hypothetical protein BJF86_13185 [Serinicoccus sp. CNJ-927]
MIPDPFEILGAGAAKLMAEGWTMIMLSLWGAGLWLTRVVLQFVEIITTPDLSTDGPARVIYQYMFGIAICLFMLLLLCQLGLALIRRDGATLGRAVWGAVQFQFAGIMWVTWCVVVFAGAGGLARIFLQTLLQVDSWAGFQPFGAFEASDVTDAVVATVIGVMGIFLVISAFAHVVILLVSSTTALVIAVTGIVSAAGLPFEATRRWFWMSFRWFHAAAFTPVILVLVLGLGTQFTQGVVIEGSEKITQDVAGAVIGIVLLCISCFAPLGLFKLLAFVDPGTNSGAALRAGMNASGGLQGLLQGGKGTGSGSASEVDGQGRSSAERSGEADTSNRLAQQGSQATGQALGAIPAIGGAAAGILGAMRTIGSQGAVVGADIANQAGIGHNTYVPDYRDNPNTSGNRNQQAHKQPDVNGTNPDGPTPSPSRVEGDQTPPTPAPRVPAPAGAPSAGSAGAAPLAPAAPVRLGEGRLGEGRQPERRPPACPPSSPDP